MTEQQKPDKPQLDPGGYLIEEETGAVTVQFERITECEGTRHAWPVDFEIGAFCVCGQCYIRKGVGIGWVVERDGEEEA